MPMLPLRDLGKYGVVTDVDPYDLPPGAFSFAKNVRFEDNKIQRGAVFRKVTDLSTGDPLHLTGFVNTAGSPTVLYTTPDGRVIEKLLDGSEASRSISGYTPIYSPLPMTSTSLNGVLYLNRGDRVPWYLQMNMAAGTAFTPIPTNDATQAQWHTDWKARVLRSFNGMLLAFNVTKGANANPNMVKWSDFVIEPYQIPPNWDYGNPESSSGENTLAEMRGDILEAYALRNRMFIFSDQETWAIDSVGGVDIFRFQRAFDRGIINTGAVVEVGGIQYVFGNNDIWMHDGTTDKSLASGRVRRFIYDSMRHEESDRFFVTQNQRLNEVIFCYISDDPYVKFPAISGGGCNRAAIFNTSSQQWYFADLPYVTSAARMPSARGTPLTFQTIAGTFADFGGAFSQLELEVKTNLTFASTAGGDITRGLRTYEAYREVETGFLFDETANGPAYLERTGIDLDEINAELRGYKCVSSIYPQGRLDYEAQPLTFSFGISDHPAIEPEWGPTQTYDRTYYKLDYNLAGRFLALKMEQSDYRPFTLSAIDLDVILLGQY